MSRRIWAWMVTSSAVVGSSARRTAGFPASAIAIMIRWHMPPDSSNGYWSSRRSGSAMPTASSMSRARARASRTPEPLVSQDGLDDLIADGHERVEGGGRLLEDDGEALAAKAAHLRLGEGDEVVPLEADASAHRAGDGREQAHDRERGHRLAAAAFADQRQDLPGVQLEADAVDHAGGADRHGEALDGEDGGASARNPRSARGAGRRARPSARRCRSSCRRRPPATAPVMKRRAVGAEKQDGARRVVRPGRPAERDARLHALDVGRRERAHDAAGREAGLDHVDPDPVRRQLEGQARGQPLQRRLGGAVGHRARRASVRAAPELMLTMAPRTPARSSGAPSRARAGTAPAGSRR